MAAEEPGIQPADTKTAQKPTAQAPAKKKGEKAADKEKVTTKPSAKAAKAARPSLPGVWGIDLGQCALKAVRLEVIDGEVTATAFDYIEHPKILSQPDAD